MKNLNITPLTQNLFTRGCQFQVLAAEEKHQLFVTEYLEITNFCLINYQFACEYGRDSFINVSRIIFSGPDYFVFEYKVLGKTELIQRYYNQFKLVCYPKHLY